MSTPSHLIVHPQPYVRALRFVWDAWRALDAGFFRAALTFATVLGIVLGASHAIGVQPITWWRGFLSEFGDTITATVGLVLCLAVAAKVRTTRFPRWVPYVLAALAAVVTDKLLAAILVGPVLHTLIDDPAQWPGHEASFLEALWTDLPRLVIFCCLAAIGYMFAREARLRADALRAIQLERATLARRTYESRLQAMQARVEPQFLFDTLEHIESLYETDADAGERMLDDLIVFLRKTLPSLEDSTSTVEAEFSLACAWLDIMKARLGSRLQHAVATPEDAAGIRMPPMLLLPLLERASEPVTSSGLPKLIELSARVVGDRLRISVLDTQPEARDRRAATVARVRKRLDSLYGSRATIESQEDDAVWRTTMEIPYERSNRDHR